MGILAISEYIRPGKRNVFIVFQMAALLFVLCLFASTLLAEYRLYRPFAQLNCVCLRQHFWRNTACIDHLRN